MLPLTRWNQTAASALVKFAPRAIVNGPLQFIFAFFLTLIYGVRIVPSDYFGTASASWRHAFKVFPVRLQRRYSGRIDKS